MADTFTLGGHEFTSRFILGSGKYSLDLIKAAVEYAGAQIVTLALRRATLGSIDNILDYIPEGVTLLPNTSGARNAEEAVRIARLAREVGCGNFIKLNVFTSPSICCRTTMRPSRQPKFWQRKALSFCRTCIRISTQHVISSMPEPLLLCRSAHRLAPTRVLSPRNSFRFS